MKVFCHCLTLLLLLSACSHLKYAEIPEYKLSKSGPFIVSESPELWRFFARDFKAQKSSVDFFVKNTDASSKSLYLNKAVLDVNGEITPVSCHPMQQGPAELRLEPSEQGRVQCDLDVHPTPGNHLAERDTVLKVEIPEENGPTLSVERLVRIEEFQ